MIRRYLEGGARSAGLAIAGVAAAGIVSASLAGSASAQKARSYTFLGVPWGSSAKDARKILAKRRFRVVAATRGPRREFAISKYHGRFKRINRGYRLIARGRMAGHSVIVDLIFGDKDQLNHVIVKSAWWNRTVRGARKMITMAKTLIQMHAVRYGAPKILADDGWPDTANWDRAADGSRLHLYVRGDKGFMFSPSYRTALRIHYYNPRYRSSNSSLTMGGGDLPKGLIGPSLAKRWRPPPPPKLTKKQKRKKRQKQFDSIDSYNN